MEYSEEEDSYQAYEDHCSQGEEEQVFTDDETNGDTPPWPGDDYSSSYYEGDSDGDELEPEPPDCSQDNYSDHSTWSSEEETDQEGNIGGDRSSQDETESQISLEEGDHESEPGYREFTHEEETFEENIQWCEIPYSDHEEEYQEETDSQISLVKSEHYVEEEFVEEEEVKSEAGRNDFEETHIKEDEDIAEEHRYIQFSGHEQGPEAYLHWENNMENWFRSQHIPKDDKLSYALDTLVGEAKEWWQQEDFWCQYSQPINTWGLLKQSMYRTFVPKSLNKSYTPKKSLFQSAPKERSAPKQPYSSKLKRKTTPTPIKRTEATLITQAREEKPKAKVVDHKQSPSSKLEPHDNVKQCKSPKLTKSKQIICYRCHKKGHFAVACPARQVDNVTTLEPKPYPSNSSDCLTQSGLEMSNSRIILLSMPKVVHTGHIMEQDVKELVRSSRLGEPHSKITFHVQASDIYEFIKYWENLMVTRSLKYTIISTYITNIMHLIFLLSVKERTGTELIKEEPPDPTPRVGNIVGKKEEPPDIEDQIQVRGRTKPTTSPPQYQDFTVSRSKLFQEGGYDAVIKPSTNHERDHIEQRQADETEGSKSTLKGPNQSQVKKELEPRTNIGVPQVMMRWIKTSSRTVLFFLHCGFIPMGFPGKVLTRQQLVGAKVPNVNCSRSYTIFITFSSHLESTSKWSQPIISSDEGGIEFLSQLNSNIPDLDRRTLKGGFRPDQEEPSNKETSYGILTHNGSSSNWNQVNTDFGLGDINFLNQMILSLPNLEADGFNHLQTRLWRPGDFIQLPETFLLFLQDHMKTTCCLKASKTTPLQLIVFITKGKTISLFWGNAFFPLPKLLKLDPPSIPPDPRHPKPLKDPDKSLKIWQLHLFKFSR